MNLFKTDLYRVYYFNNEVSNEKKAVIIHIDKVIVKKNLLSVKELLTGYSKIDVVPQSGIKNIRIFDGLKEKYWKPSKEGGHLFVVAETLSSENLATQEDIDDYVDSYDSSKWKKTYEGIKMMSRQDKAKAHHKARQVMGTKK